VNPGDVARAWRLDHADPARLWQLCWIVDLRRIAALRRDHLAQLRQPGAIRDCFARAPLAPGLVLWLAIVGFGHVLTGPLSGWDRSESALNRWLQESRDRTWDLITALWSHAGNTEIIIGVCVVAVAVLWWRTRRWWFAVIPAIAITLQATIFVTASASLAAFAIHRLASRAVRRAPAWDCGFPDPSPATQYTAGSFAQPIRRVFGGVVFGARERVEAPPPGDLAPARFVGVLPKTKAEVENE
jgi:hypothetical protein